MYYTSDFQRPMLLWLIALSVIFAANVFITQLHHYHLYPALSS